MALDLGAAWAVGVWGIGFMEAGDTLLAIAFFFVAVYFVVNGALEFWSGANEGESMVDEG